MRIGIFGGTFDPPHLGHLAVARAAIAQLELDELLFVPAARNPLKQHRALTPDRHRVRMLKALLGEEPGMAISNIEITRGGLSYAVETVEELQMVNPADYWFILGSDALDEIYQWKDPEKLARLCRLGVVLRPPHDQTRALRNVPDFFADRIDFIEMPASPIASTDIRTSFRRGKPLEEWLSPEVVDYIRRESLYRPSAAR